jgi:hypothetical protein
MLRCYHCAPDSSGSLQGGSSGQSGALAGRPRSVLLHLFVPASSSLISWLRDSFGKPPSTTGRLS